MRRNLITGKLLMAFMLIIAGSQLKAQVLEWQLHNVVHNPVDPDAGATAALSSTSFTMRVRSTGADVPDVTGFSVGWSWQSSRAMLPTGPAPIPTCGTNSITPPSNVTIHPSMGPGWTYNNVNQCSGSVNYTTGSQTFDRRSAGTIDGGTITITSAWQDVYTVTLWGLAAQNSGYVVVNSGAGGTPGAFPTYAIADASAIEYVVNSLTYTTPLLLGTAIPTPVTFIGYDVICGDKGTLVTWSTGSEVNASHYEIERSVNGSNWSKIDQVAAAGNSTITRNYQYLDLQGGDAFYRIKQVDIDGRFVHTAIKHVNCTGKKGSVVIFPVPTSNVLNLAISHDKMVRTELRILDMSGRLVKTQAVVINNGNTNITIDVSKLAMGEYMLMSSDATIQLNKKFTIAR